MRWNLALGGLAASWGFVAVLAASVELGAEALAFWRLALAAGTLAAIAVLVRRVDLLAPRGRLRALALIGVAQGAHWLLFFEAVEHGSVALAVLTFYAAPLVIALLAPLVLSERLSPVVLGACLVGAAGIAAIAFDQGGAGDSPSLAAVAAGLGSAVTYAALVILSKRLLASATPPLTVAFWDCLVGTVAVAPVLFLADRIVPSGGDEWAVALALGVVFTGVSTLVYATLLRRVTAQSAGVLTFLEPVAGVLLAWAILEQRPGAATLAGGALVIAAGLVVVVVEPAGTPVAEAPAGVGSTME
ncbi:MAG TPA: DMT family transporter [Gaiella sp.]|uniref:DMT family transporter n=1 Tax=Gaiella sp. TaxID=2663207 RepID=UPI002D8024B1|nr:DMT family transporter [Gaiella sp.]HET9288686.1 DMT family transporter [Gaiella sp.]